MPILVLLLLALASGLLIALVVRSARAGEGRHGRGRRCGRARGRGQRPADLVARADRSRAATGLALTVAVGADDRRRPRDRRAGVPGPRQRDAGLDRLERGRSGATSTRREFSTQRARTASPISATADRPVLAVAGARLRATGAPEPLLVPFMLAVFVGEQAHHERDQGSGRPRPADAEPDRRDARPVVPERSLVDRRVVLRCARADLAAAAARACAPCWRALAGAIAVAVACSRVLLDVHWLSDVIAGLFLGWAWFALCAIAFGGRRLQLRASRWSGGRRGRRDSETDAGPAGRRRCNSARSLGNAGP